MDFAQNRISLFDSLLGSGFLALSPLKRFALELMRILKSLRNPDDKSHEPEFYVAKNVQRQVQAGMIVVVT